MIMILMNDRCTDSSILTNVFWWMDGQEHPPNWERDTFSLLEHLDENMDLDKLTYFTNRDI